jgi:hypothetical protein
MTPCIIRDFLRIVRLGPVHTAGRPVIKCGCRGNFSFSQLFFPLKIENHFQKISQKNFAERVLDLLLVPGRTVSVTGENGSVT